MEKRKLLQAIEKPQQISDVSFRELREMLSDFPYFQTGYLLLAQQAMLYPENVSTTQVLAKCATYVASRERLHKLIADSLNNKADSINTEGDTLLIQSTKEEEPAPFAELPHIEPVLTPEIVRSEVETDEEENVVHFNLTTGLKRSALPDVEEVHLIDTPQPEELTPLINTLEQVIETGNTDTDNWLDKIKSRAQDYADLATEEIVLDTISIEEEARKQVEKELQKTFNTPSEDFNFDANDTDESLTTEIEAEAMQLIANDINTLREEGALDNTQQGIDDSIKSDTDLITNLKKRLEAYRNQNLEQQQPFDQWLTHQTEETNLSNEEQPTLQENLEDQSDNPEDEPIAVVEAPIEHHVFTLEDSYMTETMAKIYVRQENYARAIAIYESLCVKFPEKKPYFAAKIQEINNKLT